MLSYLPQPWANFSRVCFHITMVLFNVCSIVLCAQGMDNLLIWIFGHTCGFEVAPHFRFQSYESDGENAINGVYSGKFYRVGITAGYFLTSLVVMPLGFQSIADNTGLQILSFFFTTITIAIFFIQFCTVWSENGPEVIFPCFYSRTASPHSRVPGAQQLGVGLRGRKLLPGCYLHHDVIHVLDVHAQLDQREGPPHPTHSNQVQAAQAHTVSLRRLPRCRSGSRCGQ